MTVTAKPLINTQQAANAQTTYYTAPASTRTIIDKFSANNPTGANVTLTVNLVPNAGAAGAANQLAAKLLAPGEAYTFPEVVGHVMNSGDFISTLASVAAAATFRASGREVT